VTRARHPGGEKRLGMVWRPAALRHSFFFFFFFFAVLEKKEENKEEKERKRGE